MMTSVLEEASRVMRTNSSSKKLVDPDELSCSYLKQSFERWTGGGASTAAASSSLSASVHNCSQKLFLSPAHIMWTSWGFFYAAWWRHKPDARGARVCPLTSVLPSFRCGPRGVSEYWSGVDNQSGRDFNHLFKMQVKFLFSSRLGPDWQKHEVMNDKLLQ